MHFHDLLTVMTTSALDFAHHFRAQNRVVLFNMSNGGVTAGAAIPGFDGGAPAWQVHMDIGLRDNEDLRVDLWCNGNGTLFSARISKRRHSLIAEIHQTYRTATLTVSDLVDLYRQIEL